MEVLESKEADAPDFAPLLCFGAKRRDCEDKKRKYRVTDAQVAYLGDDFLALPIMRRVGLPMAVQDATPEVKRIARYVTKKKGGEGAVGEALRLILQAQGTWTRSVEATVSEAYR